MKTKSIKFLALLLSAGCMQVALSQGFAVKITVENSSLISRANEPVIVPWSKLPDRVRQANRENLRLLDDRGRSLAFQVDDMDGDGRPDELVFIADVESQERVTFALTDTAASLASPAGPLRTDAGNWKRTKSGRISLDDDDGPGLLRSQSSYVFDGVGWESELIGYRLYLDERNALDVQAKRHPGLHWNFIGSSGLDYQLDAYWGMDVLHVGPALGVGGFGFWVSDSLVKPFPLESRRTRILARGPVRAVVRVDYVGWKVGGETVDVSLHGVIYRGSRVTLLTLSLLRGPSQTVAVGIVKHAGGTPVWNPDQGALFTLGRQSRTNDSLLLAVNVPGASVRKGEDGNNHLVLFPLERNGARTYAVTALWEGEQERMWTRTGAADFLGTVSRRISHPLTISLD